MQTKSQTAAGRSRDQTQTRIALYKAISITAGRLAEQLAVLERNPIYMKGGDARGKDERVRPYC